MADDDHDLEDDDERQRQRFVITVCDSDSCRADFPQTVSAKVLTPYLNGIRP
jgi:hypothetical protein